ncbi:MAG: hypothetical protein H8E66_18925 [Planctomycetes bacterium]|nr:hypothetical protein [Planctomycetota bacterium]
MTTSAIVPELLSVDFFTSSISGSTMAEIPDSRAQIELLVNCKTYPAVSTKYTETVCTGGVDHDGNFIRLYPIPFRLLEKDEQYSRWDIIRVSAYRDTKDQRPESWHYVHGTPIEVIGKVESEKERWDWMRTVIFHGAQDLESQGLTNGLVEIEPLEFFWKPDKTEWTEKQKSEIRQGSLMFDKTDIAERVPYQFRLKYREIATGREGEGKVLAWSYYVGFLRQRSTLGSDEAALNAIVDIVKGRIFSSKNRVFAILGAHSRFGSWMISALYHVKKEVCRQKGFL